MAEYMNFNRNRRKSKSDLKNQNFDDQFWTTNDIYIYIYIHLTFSEEYYMSWLSETIFSFKIASKLLKLFTHVRFKFFSFHRRAHRTALSQEEEKEKEEEEQPAKLMFLQ